MRDDGADSDVAELPREDHGAERGPAPPTAMPDQGASTAAPPATPRRADVSARVTGAAAVHGPRSGRPIPGEVKRYKRLPSGRARARRRGARAG